jgi:hypothetical protein
LLIEKGNAAQMEHKSVLMMDATVAACVPPQSR